MKSLSVVFCVFLFFALTACAPYSGLNSPWHKHMAMERLEPAELDAFVQAAEEAAEKLVVAETLSDWQSDYDKVAELETRVPLEALSKSQQKGCNAIMDQMELGKLAAQLRKVDPKPGKKQCATVAKEILKHAQTLREGDFRL
jgi:hypothetical protein